MAEEQIKFTEDELKEIQDLSLTYQKRQSELGQIAVQKILMEQRVNSFVEREDAIKNVMETNQRVIPNPAPG